jgi:hypothetical protein
VPADLAAGDYALTLALPQGGSAAPLTLGTVAIGPSTRLYEVPPLTRTLHMTLTTEENSEIALVGLGAEPTFDPTTGEVTVELVWQPVAAIKGNYKAFVHLLDNAGNIVAQSDAVPGGTQVTSRWLAGEVILDRHLLTLLPESIERDNLASYQLVAGLYDAISMVRLTARAADGSEIADQRVPLGAPILPTP